jgi:hypothetical protein
MEKYTIIIGSPIKYDYLTADIQIGELYIARIQLPAMYMRECWYAAPLPKNTIISMTVDFALILLSCAAI